MRGEWAVSERTEPNLALKEKLITLLRRILLLIAPLAALTPLSLQTEFVAYLQTEPSEKLDAPTLTAATTDSDNVEISWTEVAGADHYDLRVWRSSVTGWEPIEEGSYSGRSYTGHVLAAGMPDHYYAVAAVDSEGVIGVWSNQVRITAPDKLPAPNLTATETGATAIELSWTEMPDADGFELFTWWASDPGWQLIDDAVEGASYTHSGLSPGWTYFYAIRAIGSNGLMGEWSNIPHATVPETQAPTASPTPTTTPAPTSSRTPMPTPTSTPTVTGRLAAPTLTITETLTTRIELSWTDDARADRYELWTWWAQVPGWQPVDDNLRETSYVHRGLVPGRTYYYAIRAVDPQGVEGEWSAFPSATVPTTTQMTEAAQREALVALYRATDGASWTHSDNWLTSEPISTWYGVVVDADGKVSELLLTGNNLRGSIPNLSTLDGLTILSLGSNLLSGSIPELSALTGLSFLDLSFNQFTGSIPQLNSLTNLEWLSINNNQLTGTLPNMSALTRLRSLSLGSNQFSGSIPDLSTLTNLRELYLTDSNLSGSIPDLSALTELTHLYLGDNRLTGSFPDVGTLNSLIWVDLSHNLLEGSVPDLSALANLTWLSLSRNQFSGQVPDISALTKLRVLQLGHNRLTGPVPDLSPLKTLIVLDLAGNELCLPEGPIQSDTSTAVAAHLADLNLPECPMANSSSVKMPTLLGKRPGYLDEWQEPLQDSALWRSQSESPICSVTDTFSCPSFFGEPNRMRDNQMLTVAHFSDDWLAIRRRKAEIPTNRRPVSLFQAVPGFIFPT